MAIVGDVRCLLLCRENQCIAGTWAQNDLAETIAAWRTDEERNGIHFGEACSIASFSMCKPVWWFTPRLISERGNKKFTIDWSSSGCIVVNDDSGADIDIFFSLEDATTPGKKVVFVDHRNRQFGKIQRSHATKYLTKMTDIPTFLKDIGACLVRGFMNCVSMSNIAEFAVPPNCSLMSQDETAEFHGTLKYHPACSPIIPVNSASKTTLKTVLERDPKVVDEVDDEEIGYHAERPGCLPDWH